MPAGLSHVGASQQHQALGSLEVGAGTEGTQAAPAASMRVWGVPGYAALSWGLVCTDVCVAGAVVGRRCQAQGALCLPGIWAQGGATDARLRPGCSWLPGAEMRSVAGEVAPSCLGCHGAGANQARGGARKADMDGQRGAQQSGGAGRDGAAATAGC